MATAYIETTIPSYYVARPSNSLLHAAKQSCTQDWWDSGCSGFELFTSLETMDEVAKGDGQMATDRLNLLGSIPLLTMTNDAIALAGQLVSVGIVPAKTASDSLHIAVAFIHEIDYLVTWNFKHIANPFLRDRLRNAVNQAGYELPVMCSPEQLLQNDEDN